jgi:hypothetical protein
VGRESQRRIAAARFDRIGQGDVVARHGSSIAGGATANVC